MISSGRAIFLSMMSSMSLHPSRIIAFFNCRTSSSTAVVAISDSAPDVNVSLEFLAIHITSNQKMAKQATVFTTVPVAVTDVQLPAPVRQEKLVAFVEWGDRVQTDFPVVNTVPSNFNA